MIKDIQDKNATVKANDKEMKILKENFPNCFNKEGKFDIEKFKLEIKESVDVTEEGYRLDFLGKNYAKLISGLDTETVIIPNVEYNEKNKDSKNLYITGDNLDVLKHLTKSYAGSVDVIYIDPPYNTGNDGFVYNDKFKFTANELMGKLNISEQEANRIMDFTDKGSASHSAWLTFMFPRLYIAKHLLSESGVIFISIDDNEVNQLKLLCDDIFGEENFVENFMWLHGKGKKTTHSRTLQQYNLCYANDFSSLNEWKEKSYTNYELSNPDNDQKGAWFSGSISFDEKRTNPLHENYYEISSPSGIKWKRQWLVSKFEMEELINAGDIYFGTSPSYNQTPRKKIRPSIIDVIPQNIIDNVGTTKSAINDLTNLLGQDIFSYPKPVGLLKHFFEIVSNKNALILDFFSGSGTTAQAVMELNAEDDGNRNFILVQLPESVDSKEFKTIDEIGRKRIELSADKIRKEHPEYKGDLGFKHYTVENIENKTLDKIESFDPDIEITDLVDEIGKDTILTTWLCADGYGIDAEDCRIDLGGYNAYLIGKHLYMIDEGFTSNNLDVLMKKFIDEPDFTPEHIIVFGYSFNDWTVIEMLDKNLKALKSMEKSISVDISSRL